MPETSFTILELYLNSPEFLSLVRSWFGALFLKPFLYGLCFKFYFVWLWVLQSLLSCHFHEYLFPSPYFQSMCVLCPKVGLLWQHIVVCWFCFVFLIQSATLCLLIGTFSPLTFKVIIDRYLLYLLYLLGFPRSSVGRVWLQCRRPGFNPWVRKIPWRRKWPSTSAFLPGASCRQRSLAGYSLWGHKSWKWLSD